MKVSVVMATYNGEAYIFKQMQSILNQYYKPDEVIIYDDRSTDNTVKIVTKFIEENNLSNWTLKVNYKNEGWKKNFYKSLKEASEELIFFCDQDDIWEPDKINIMREKMLENRNILALAGRMRLIDENDKILPPSKILPFSGENSGKIYKNKFNSKFVYTIVPGCTLCIKSDLLKYMDMLDFSIIPHDSLFWKIATILDGAYYIDLDIIKYRVHSNNASGATTENIIGKSSIQNRIEGIRDNKKLTEQFLNLVNDNDEIYCNKYKTNIIKQNINILNKRLKLLENKNLLYIPILIINHKYYPSLKAIIGDITYIFNINKISGNIWWKIYGDKN